jgi:hypothetical protein
MSNKFQPRYQVFFDAFGKQKNWVYLDFIKKMKLSYMKSIYPNISNVDALYKTLESQEGFDVFIKENLYLHILPEGVDHEATNTTNRHRDAQLDD